MARYRERMMLNEDFGDGYNFETPFLGRMACVYLINTVASSYLRQKPVEVFKSLMEILGYQYVVNFLKIKYPKARIPGSKETIWSDEHLLQDLSYKDLQKSLGSERVLHFIQTYLAGEIMKLKQNFEAPTDTDQKLAELQDIFRLSNAEVKVLTFLFSIQNCTFLDHCYHYNIDDFRSCSTLINLSWKIIGISLHECKNVFNERGNLMRCVLQKDNPYELPKWLVNYLLGFDKELKSEFFSEFKGETLSINDHFAQESEIQVLKGLIAGKGTVNILFYGESGTGKTTLVQSLAEHCGKTLYIINNNDGEYMHCNTSRAAITAACNSIDPQNALILVDEADRLLNTSFSYFFSGEKNEKSWINRFLEESSHKIVWISNAREFIDPSTMRRFAFSMKFKKFNLRKKVKVFTYCMEKHGLKDFFAVEEINQICNRYAINAGGISDAFKNLEISRDMDKNIALEKLDTVLKNHQIAITGRDLKRDMKSLGTYNLSALNPSSNLDAVIDSLKYFLARTGKVCGSMNILLYGPPGSGKTEFVKYMGKVLEKEIILKRTSDLLSSWVGGTEELIAQAFDEAVEDGGILFLDEADSFLSPREAAMRSWEKTQVNELLTQMENFDGILVCATNFLKGLDQAALRRFKYKIEFRPLTCDGALEMYRTLLLPLTGTEEIPEKNKLRLRRMENLTPGDFHAVAEKFTFIESGKTDHAALIASLEEELRFKPKSKTIGFAD